jgi:uncharacterized circularly permuted ATP-grasp superfamily protein/uncharacterized alpha-E superfamily protein
MADRIRFSSPSSPQPSAPAAGSVWDEMTDASGRIRPQWAQLSAKFQQFTPDQRASLLKSAGRMIADLGTTFNVYSDVGGAGQPYELDPLPLMIPAGEWAQVAAGLAQRVRLIELVLADIYGPRKLLKEGLLPPDLVNASPAYLPYSRGVTPMGGHFVVTTGCDLMRSASGQWMVLRDLTNVPGGLGQVLENRNVTSKLLSAEFDNLRITRLGNFLDLERNTLESLMPTREESPNIVLLTPGFHHPSYFEHAYKARLLGFPLVEPADLTVRERRLFLKTLAGLRRIDGVACRVDGEALDPLEQWLQGGGGIPGIVEAWRTGNVALANAPGAGFASTPALMPFLPGICRKWLGEELKLPFVETWWLSQPEVRRRVLDQLPRYVLLSAFNRDPLLPVRCSTLSPSARKQWIAAIEERPFDFVAQLDTEPSLAPTLEPRGLRQRPVIWRTFTVNGAERPVVMAGGFAKLGKAGQSPQLWPAHEGITKDVWVPESAPPVEAVKDIYSLHRRHPSALEVPSRIAEQLFWVGRYAERIEFATRLLRVTLRHLGGESGRLQHDPSAACLRLLRGCHMLPKESITQPVQTLRVLAGLIHDQAVRGGIPSLTRSLLINAAAARDRLSDDTWRIFNRLDAVVQSTPNSASASELLGTLDSLVLHLSAIAGMEAENMTRGQGWRFFEVGRRIERGLGAMALLRTATAQKAGEPSVLGPLLEACDSVMTYRRRHFSQPLLEPVMQLIFFDLSNPRSVAYQFGILEAECARFPGDPEFGLMPQIRGQLQTMLGRFSDPEPPTESELKALSSALESFADLLTQHYFSHSVRRVY